MKEPVFANKQSKANQKFAHSSPNPGKQIATTILCFIQPCSFRECLKPVPLQSFSPFSDLYKKYSLL
jgi:hypothetical protein